MTLIVITQYLRIKQQVFISQAIERTRCRRRSHQPTRLRQVSGRPPRPVPAGCRYPANPRFLGQAVDGALASVDEQLAMSGANEFLSIVTRFNSLHLISLVLSWTITIRYDFIR